MVFGRKPQANPKLKLQVRELLFERDYNEIAGMSEDYCNPLDITR